MVLILVGIGMLASPVAAMDTHPKPVSFQPIEQPLPIKLGVTAIGIGLIGAELAWFLKK